MSFEDTHRRYLNALEATKDLFCDLGDRETAIERCRQRINELQTEWAGHIRLLESTYPMYAACSWADDAYRMKLLTEIIPEEVGRGAGIIHSLLMEIAEFERLMAEPLSDKDKDCLLGKEEWGDDSH